MSEWNWHGPKPGSPGYVNVEEHTRREVARRAEWAKRPDVIALEELKRQGAERRAAERNAKRKHPKFVQTTDYLWLRPGWEW